MVVTGAQRGVQMARCAAEGKLPFRGLCVRQQGPWFIPTQSLHLGRGSQGRAGSQVWSTCYELWSVPRNLRAVRLTVC